MNDKLKILTELKCQVQRLEEQILKELGGDTVTRDRSKNLYQMLNVICDAFHITTKEICSQKKSGHLVFARCLFTHVALEKNYQKIEIGAALCRDHSTIVYYNKVDFNYRRLMFPEYEKFTVNALDKIHQL